MFSEPYGAVREVLRQHREAAGLPQRELAKRIGKSASHVAMIERGQRRIDTLELYRVARALGLPPAELFAQIAGAIAQAEAGFAE